MPRSGWSSTTGPMFELSSDAVPRFVPNWPLCSGSCRGRQIEGLDHCLAHLSEDDLNAFLKSIRPGASFDLRGTTLSAELLQQLLARVSVSPVDPNSPVHLGEADFSFCTFQNQAVFRGARFEGRAGFVGVRFAGTAVFDGVRFAGRAVFDGAQFADTAVFVDAQFAGTAKFDGARFQGRAGFVGAQFAGTAGFGDVRFAGRAVFDGALFAGESALNSARFDGQVSLVGARFESARVGPLVADQVDVSRASFAKRVVVEVEAGALVVADARFEEGVELRVRYASVSLRRVFFGGPSSVSGAAEPFTPVGGVACRYVCGRSWWCSP